MGFDRRSFLHKLTGLGAVSAAVGVCALWDESSDSSDRPIRPPGALPEADFLATCIRCMRCVDACPNHAIKSLPLSQGRDVAGTPYIKPREQTCMLCSRIDSGFLRCTEACPSGALRPIRKDLDEVRQRVQMGVAQIDLNLCYSYNNYTCGTCFHACPMQAIKIGLWERPQIVAEACIGCGLCERACIRYPQAIRITAVDRDAGQTSDKGPGQRDQSPRAAPRQAAIPDPGPAAPGPACEEALG